MLDHKMATLIEVCKHMNYSRAAEELHLAQSTVSLHIKSLEEYYGARLFEFEGKKPVLTEAGRLVLEAATIRSRDEEQLKQKIRLKQRAPIRLGATLSVAENMICEPLASFLKNHPRDYIQIDIDNTAALINKINEGILDTAFLEGPFPVREFDSLAYRTEGFKAICAPDYLADDGGKHIKDVFGIPLLLREEGSGSRKLLESFLAQRGYSLRNFTRIIEIGSIHVIKQMVMQGCGISFLYESAVRSELNSGLLRSVFDEEEIADFRYNIYYAWRKGSIYADEYVKVFNEFALHSA